MIAHHDDISLEPVKADSKMPRLTDLPDELLLGVMSFMGTTTLLNVKLVCHHFNDLADQFLYENPKVLRGIHARKLAIALAAKSNRVSWVKELLVSTRFGDDYGLKCLPPHIAAMRQLEVLVLETPDCNSRKPEERTSWIRLQDNYERIFELSSLQHPQGHRPLPFLRECTLHFVDSRSELYSLTKYASLFLHPNLKSLTISCSSTNNPSELSKALKNPVRFKQSTELEHLHLEECDIHGPSLALLLSLPRALKSFKFSEGVRYDGLFRTGARRMHGNIRPHHLMEALTQTCADSLESLSLMLGYRRPVAHSFNDIGQHLNMTAMESLKFLELDSKTLDLLRPRATCDHNTWLRFPPRLETLKVSSIRLSGNSPFESFHAPYMPLETCLIKDKTKHGVSLLKNVVFSYEYNDVEDDFNDIDDLLLLGPVHLPPPPAPAPLPVPAPVGPNDDLIDPLHVPQDPGPVPVNVAAQQAAPTNNDDGDNPHEPPPLPPLDIILNTVNPGNLNQAQQFLRQHWFTHANRARYNQFRPISQPREFSRLERSKIALLNILNNDMLPEYRQASVRLIVDLVKLPRGFIPPYLFPEDKPSTTSVWWDSDDAKETEVYKREIKLEQEARAFERNMQAERERRRRHEEVLSGPARERRMDVDEMRDVRTFGGLIDPEDDDVGESGSEEDDDENDLNFGIQNDGSEDDDDDDGDDDGDDDSSDISDSTFIPEHDEDDIDDRSDSDYGIIQDSDALSFLPRRMISSELHRISGGESSAVHSRGPVPVLSGNTPTSPDSDGDAEYVDAQSEMPG